MSEVALIGFVQTLFFSFLIATKKKKEIKDYLLVVFLLFAGAELIYRYLIKTIPESDNKWLTLFDISYWALFGPVTLMYILYSINKVKKFRYLQLMHLIPLLTGLFAIKNYFFGNVAYNSFIEYFNESKGITKAELFCWEFTSPVYIVYSLYLLIIHKKSAKNYFSDISAKDFTWLYWLVAGFVIYMIVSYIVWFSQDVLHVEIKFNYLEILPAILTIYVFFIGYWGYKQAGIFFDYPVSERRLKQKRSGDEDCKYGKSGLSDVERMELINRLKEVMEAEKPYLENDLNINVLARMLNTTFHKLSQVINDSFHKNFYDFINTYRIKESKRLLKNPENDKYTIISIAYICGFSSKSSFYNAFRKNTGVTPGEYLKNIKSLRSTVMPN
ncbi:MAG TPA: helix-turn-helix domain-containing protein [Bacteroidales bacterium]|nr:helix-turn-helix domain-containing protein [Bacteroidales bacterium]